MGSTTDSAAAGGNPSGVVETKLLAPAPRSEQAASEANRAARGGLGANRVGDFVKAAPNAHFLSLTKPTGIVRLAFRLPAYHYGYGANLGWMLGHRFLHLTHRGRRIGRAHHRVLEVLCYDLATWGSLVLSAWEDELYAPVQRFLGPEETRAALADFERRYTFFSRLVSRMLGSPLDGTQTAQTNLASRVRMVAFSPTRASLGRG